jgi:flagellin FlaB
MKKKMENWMKTIRRFARNRKAVSGLETAIVLIAFVIVASAFAYAVLNMGFLATQKSQEVVVGGLQAASAATVLDGPVYGYSTTAGRRKAEAKVTV